MAELDYLSDKENVVYTAEKTDGVVDHESFDIIQEIGDQLPHREHHNDYQNISFPKEFEHIGLMASLLAEYLEMNPLKKEDSINVSGKTADILASLHIPFALEPDEPTYSENQRNNIISINEKHNDL